MVFYREAECVGLPVFYFEIIFEKTREKSKKPLYLMTKYGIIVVLDNITQHDWGFYNEND